MTKVAIYVNVEDEYADDAHPMGITNEAFEQLTGYPAPLTWLGEVEDVQRVSDE